VIDDGAGLNRPASWRRPGTGLRSMTQMSDYEVWQLIFAPGFSTADVVTDVSGRGVGMDVVKRNIEGHGRPRRTRILARLRHPHDRDPPAADPGHPRWHVGRCWQAKPSSCRSPTWSNRCNPSATMIRTMAGVERMIQVRGEYLPFIVTLAEVFGLDGGGHHQGACMVVVEAEEGKAALFVDELLGQHQVVIKSLEANYRKVPGMSGATIMGDGRVALILDVAALVQMGKASPAPGGLKLASDNTQGMT
jgi:two-component system chemotaxis sensor kinase CheA